MKHHMHDFRDGSITLSHTLYDLKPITSDIDIWFSGICGMIIQVSFEMLLLESFCGKNNTTPRAEP